MTDGYRPTLPHPSDKYTEFDQQNNRRELQRVFDFKMNRNEFEIYKAETEERLKAIEARLTALETP